MTKPLIEDTRWAVTSGGVESTEVADIDGDVKDNGYPIDATPDNKNWNWWHRKAYAWFQYLNGGVLDGLSYSLASTTYTANATTNELTASTPHGAVTGAGPLRLFNSGGAPPAPLAVATDYYAIVTGASTMKVARSRSDALSGRFIGLTSAGTGTNSVATLNATSPAPLTVVGDLDATRILPLVNAGGSSIAAEWTIADGAWSTPGTGGIGEGIMPLSTGSSGTLIRSMRLAPGTLLSRLRYGYDLGVSGNSVSLWLFNRKIDGSAGGGVNLGGDSSSTGYQMGDVSTFGVDETTGIFDGSAGPHVVQFGWIYFFQLVFTRASGTVKFYGDAVNG